jgi:hypothetical protein
MAIVAIMLLPMAGNTETTKQAGQPSITWNADAGRAMLTNGRLELAVETKLGVNARSLRDLGSGQVYADRDYAWISGGSLGFPKLDAAPVIADVKNGGRSISFKGRLGTIAVEQLFTLPKNEPGVILEQITISNPTDKPLDTSGFRCGFVKHLRNGGTWSPDATKIRFCPIPYRRETNGQMQEFALQEVAAHGMSYTGWMEPVVPTPIWGAEGWVWSYSSPLLLGEGQGVRAARSGQWSVASGQAETYSTNPQSPIPNPQVGSPHPNPLPKGEGTFDSNPLAKGEGTESSPHPNPLPKGEGTSAFLIAKHNQQGMEWSLMEPLKRGTETLVRFGGAGQWKHGHPEGATRLEPGQSYRFGETRLQAIGGDWKQAYYAYRHYVEGRGCRRPKDYNPPVHWNELYDNEYFGRVCGLCDEYFFKPNPRGFCKEFYEKNEKLLRDYYSLDLMKAEAAKAHELGCEVLYLDPGWDTGLSQHIWDASRLGSQESFVKMIREKYNLRGVSLWCSLAGVPPTIGDPAACPPGTQVLTKEGKRAPLLVCSPSPGFLDTKEKRLCEVCRNGAVFLMFDSDQYSGPCYDKTHGHSIPSTREEHAKALFELARRVKVKHPNVLIEMHDPITGPSGIHYTPSYFGYAPPHSFDCLWGHEFMWNSMDDLLSGRAVSLYYYNLAYGIPLYLHVGLKTDNEQALVFWWFASTCRHLGVGGKPAAAVWEADKRAMRTYLPLKRFYTQGEFYGIEETVHAHTLPDLRESVLNVFNLSDKPIEKEVRIQPADIGLPSDSTQIQMQYDGVSATVSGNHVSASTTITVPAHGHQLIKVKAL